jgi:hypothetical protein
MAPLPPRLSLQPCSIGLVGTPTEPALHPRQHGASGSQRAASRNAREAEAGRWLNVGTCFVAAGELSCRLPLARVAGWKQKSDRRPRHRSHAPGRDAAHAREYSLSAR